MPIILVVDDSEVDRHLTGKILQKDLDWLVEFADNGVQALDMMRSATPDVVVTDLLMPEMDGLELVSEVRKQFSRVPVILVTGQGSEEMASRALSRGAASYVPKSHLNETLIETVEQVLSLSKADRDLERLMRCSTNVRNKFQLKSDPLLISSFIDYVQQTMDMMQFCQAAERMHVAVALEEALLNSMLHGNLELPKEVLSEVRNELHSKGRSDTIETRRREAPYSDRKILVGFDLTYDRAEFVIRDQGPGFDTSLPSPSETLSGGKGRGLALMQFFMSEIHFNKTGNEVRMVLKRPPEVEEVG